MLNDVGLNVSLQMYEVGRWNEFFVKPYPEHRPVTLTEQMHDNAKGDPVFTAFVKYASQGAHSMLNDSEGRRADRAGDGGEWRRAHQALAAGVRPGERRRS